MDGIEHDVDRGSGVMMYILSSINICFSTEKLMGGYKDMVIA
jgi:hypothetical protein